jgi:hypothetical protein
VGLEQHPLSLVSTTEELLGRKNSSSGLENREYSHRDVLLTMWHPLSAKIGTNSPTSSGRSVGIVRSQTQATEFIHADSRDHPASYTVDSGDYYIHTVPRLRMVQLYCHPSKSLLSMVLN